MAIEKLKTIAEAIDWTPLENRLSEKFFTPVKLKMQIIDLMEPRIKINLESKNFLPLLGVDPQSDDSTMTIRALGIFLKPDQTKLHITMELRMETPHGSTGRDLLKASYEIPSQVWSFEVA